MSLIFLNAEISNGALNGKNLPKEIKVLSWGKNTTTQGDVYLTDETLKTFDSYQKKWGRDEDVALDFDHNTVEDSKEYVKGAPKKIAAYGDPKLVKGDGLYLTNLQWTPLGEENARNYKDISPAVKVNPRGVVEGLHSVALTPNGSVHGLKFYSADNIMLNGKIVAKDATDAAAFDADDYNKDGANAGVKKVGNQYLPNVNLDSGKNNDEDCEDDLKEFDAEDHLSKYGDVAYADVENHKYPIDTKEHVKAAWSYINMPKNAAKYDSSKLSTIKGKIKNAMAKHGIDNSEDADKPKTMSAENPSFPDAYKWQPQQYNNTMNTAIKKMAVEVGMDNESDTEKVLNAFLAKYEGQKTELSQQITRKDNTAEGGLKQFSATIETLEKKIQVLEAKNESDNKNLSEMKRQNLKSQAAKEGKMIPLSADAIATVDVEILEEIIKNQPKQGIPTSSQLKTLSADATQKPSKMKSVSSFETQIQRNLEAHGIRN